jgi:ribosomal protein S18 acetylase RimI-like enzyme
MPLTIKKITQEDEIHQAARLARQIWTEHYTPLIGAAQVRYMLEKFQSSEAIRAQMQEDGYIYYLAFWHDESVAYCAIQADAEKKSVFLSKLYVDADYRGRGIAVAFLHVIKNEFDGKVDRIWLTVNKGNAGSIDAYKKMGFVVESSLVTDIGCGFRMDDYKMILRLSD